MQIQVYSSAFKGIREYMEDRVVYVYSQKEHLLGVFDGHGGAETAQLCLDKFSELLINNILSAIPTDAKSANFEKIKNVICRSFLDFDRFLYHKLETESGSTAGLCYLDHSFLCFMNVGDSQGAYFDNKGNIIYQTPLHKVSLPGEKERILAAQHLVMDDRVDGLISVTRALGDFAFKLNADRSDLMGENAAVSCVPHVEFLTPIRSKEKSYLVLASDGLWDVVSLQEVTQFVLEQPLDQKRIDALGQLALERDSKDNISIVIAELIYDD